MYKITDIEKKYVYEFYNNIADHWYHTRNRKCSNWSVVNKFLNSLDSYSFVADIGTGSGRFMNIRKDLNFIGIDASISLLQICKKNKLEVVCNNILNICIKDNSVDATICIAVLHHLSTEENRLQAIKELIRITKIKGRILIYVWAFKQDNNSRVSQSKFKEKDCLVPWHLQEKYINKSEISNYKSILYDSKEKLYIFQRYCHLFSTNELDNLLNNIKNICIINKGYDKGNLYIEIEKQS